jgi:hypothetical protein
MVAVIIACEVGFWVLLGCGLAARYVLRAKLLSTVLLLAVPLVDVVLLAAVYIGVSLAFGRQMIRWADQRFAHRFAGGPAPTRPPRAGRDHATHERRQWLRHLLAYVIAIAVLGLFTGLVGSAARTMPLWTVMVPWTIALVVDFIISFSYTLAPRKPKVSSAETRRNNS